METAGKEGSYKASEMHGNVEKEIQRLRDQALWGWDKESRNLVWFGLKDGMSVLEVGSGPGFITEQLLAMLPNITVTCLEIDPQLIQRAEAYLGSKPGLKGRYRIIRDDVMHMELPDNSHDFAFARLIFQHLPDPLGAMQDIRRVLRPGGKLAITDAGALDPIIHPTSQDAEAITAKFTKAQEQRGGHKRIGRRLWRLLGQAGFVNMDLEAIVVHSDKLGIEALAPSEWDPEAFKHWLKSGVITPEDVETIHKGHIEFHAAPDKYVMLTPMMACGEKPNNA